MVVGGEDLRPTGNGVEDVAFFLLIVGFVYVSVALSKLLRYRL
jgi:hypothetical protein